MKVPKSRGTLWVVPFEGILFDLGCKKMHPFFGKCPDRAELETCVLLRRHCRIRTLKDPFLMGVNCYAEVFLAARQQVTEIFSESFSFSNFQPGLRSTNLPFSSHRFRCCCDLVSGRWGSLFSPLRVPLTEPLKEPLRVLPKKSAPPPPRGSARRGAVRDSRRSQGRLSRGRRAKSALKDSFRTPSPDRPPASRLTQSYRNCNLF